MLSRRGTGRSLLTPGSGMAYEPGAFCWVGLATSDLVNATAFYARLFSWRSEELPAGGFGAYRSLRRGDKEVAILYRQTREARAVQAPPHWTPLVLVVDAEASSLRVKELGGSILRDPLDLADAGRVAAVRDPLGGILSLWEAHAHAGAELTDDVGGLCWHELVTPDVERAKSFYGPLFGWQFAADSSGLATIINVGSHIGTMREQRQRQGALARSWISYFAVESARDAADTAEQNGGQIATEPADGPRGRTARLADPQGATFAVLELPARDESG
jgi:uncharacterized protein